MVGFTAGLVKHPSSFPLEICHGFATGNVYRDLPEGFRDKIFNFTKAFHNKTEGGELAGSVGYQLVGQGLWEDPLKSKRLKTREGGPDTKIEFLTSVHGLADTFIEGCEVIDCSVNGGGGDFGEFSP